NEAIRVVNADGSVVCEPDSDTTYTAGVGSAINGTSIAASLAQVQARVTAAGTADQSLQSSTTAGSVLCDADDNTSCAPGPGLSLDGTTIGADAAYMQRRVTGSCPANASIKSVNADGSVICEAENVTTPGTGLTLAGGIMSIATGGVGTAQ